MTSVPGARSSRRAVRPESEARGLKRHSPWLSGGLRCGGGTFHAGTSPRSEAAALVGAREPRHYQQCPSPGGPSHQHPPGRRSRFPQERRGNSGIQTNPTACLSPTPHPLGPQPPGLGPGPGGTTLQRSFVVPAPTHLTAGSGAGGTRGGGRDAGRGLEHPPGRCLGPAPPLPCPAVVQAAEAPSSPYAAAPPRIRLGFGSCLVRKDIFASEHKQQVWRVT